MSELGDTVFISYRRNVSAFIARTVFMDLRQHNYDVFMDVEGIDSGQFDRVLLNEIERRGHFVLVLTPGSIERCVEPNDWLRREIEFAMELRRNIVPLLANGFTFAGSEAYLTGNLSELSKYNALNVPHDYFDAAMEKLRSRFLKQPVYGAVKSTRSNYQMVISRLSNQNLSSSSSNDEQKKAEENFKLGLMKQSEDDLTGAIEAYTEAIRLNPQHAQAYNNRGGIHKAQGNQAAAIADYTQAIQLNPLHSNAYINRGKILLQQTNILEAMSDFSKSIDLAPNNPLPYFDRGNIFYQIGQYAEAISDYTKLIELDPTDELAYNNRGEAYFALGQVAKALSDFQKRQTINPNLFGYAGIAISLHALGQLREAKEAWQLLVAENANCQNIDWLAKQLNWAKPLADEARLLVAQL